jgi:hypothetical protein
MYKDGTRPAGVNAEVQARRVAAQHAIADLTDQYVAIIGPDTDDDRLSDLQLQVDRVRAAVERGEPTRDILVSAGGCIQAWLESIAASEAR